MMEEEGAVIAGLLVGLNVIDANLCMKGEDLDSQVILLSLSLLPQLRAGTQEHFWSSGRTGKKIVLVFMWVKQE